jgi:hypothetical protein
LHPQTVTLPLSTNAIGLLIVISQNFLSIARLAQQLYGSASNHQRYNSMTWPAGLSISFCCCHAPNLTATTIVNSMVNTNSTT